MCGINGIFAYHSGADQIDPTELARTRDHMAARGPDGKGKWISDTGRVGFGHRRLSIIDLSDVASQPMSNADGALVVTFNGEIYNYRELRRWLEAKGRVFRSHSDTEVLLHLYAEKGQEMVHDLRGMFALAIWDRIRGELFLARDPYGIKPLYYADDGRTFRFASQVKALLAGGGVDDRCDPAGHVGFYLFGSLPEPLTLYEQIKALPAGHTMSVSPAGAGALRRYYSVAEAYVRAETMPRLAGQARQAAAREALLDSVRHHLVADVPVGAFLSAGIDSSALVGLMRDAGQSEIETVTLAFKEFEDSVNDEAPIAEEVARTYRTRHTTRVVTKAEFDADLPHILAAMDQPSVDGVNMWFVSKAARERGLKVAISGIGGDELLGGYPAFRDIPKWVAWLSVPATIPGLGKFVRRVVMAAGPRRFGVSAKAAGMLEYGGSYEGAWLLRRGLYMPWELDGVLEREIVSEGLSRLSPRATIGAALNPRPSRGFARVACMEASLYMRNQLLRDADWASMAHSLEVRTPLVDAVLLKQIAALGPPDTDLPAKTELALAPSIPLPTGVTQRRKTGFGVPVGAWLARESPCPALGKRASVYAHTRGWAREVARRQPSACFEQTLAV
jgi:asparagine synthase (glutamine-hydrolysing)